MVQDQLDDGLLLDVTDYSSFFIYPGYLCGSGCCTERVGWGGSDFGNEFGDDEEYLDVVE